MAELYTKKNTYNLRSKRIVRFSGQPSMFFYRSSFGNHILTGIKVEIIGTDNTKYSLWLGNDDLERIDNIRKEYASEFCQSANPIDKG